MKIQYKPLLLAIASFFSLSAFAQQASPKDSTLNRQVMLERDYDPNVKDASKINTIPAVYSPVSQPTSVQPIDRTPSVLFKAETPVAVSPGEVRTNVDYSDKKGYVSLGAGMKSTLDGAFGVNMLNNDINLLNLNASHQSMNGNVDYANPDFYPTNAKAKYMNNNIGLRFKHMTDAIVFSFDGRFNNQSFNYYGNPFLSQTLTSVPENLERDDKQVVNTFGGTVGIKSADANAGLLRYDINAGYDYFTYKYGPIISKDGTKGGIIRGSVNLYTPFGSDRLIGIKGKVMNQHLTEPAFFNSLPKNDNFHTLTSLEVTPYVDFEGANYFLHLGVNAGYAIDKENKFNIAPDVKLNFIVAERSSLYLNATGGINENTLLQILSENRYMDLSSRVAYSRTLVDGQLGFRSGIVNGVEFDIFGGYKYTKNDHFYIAAISGVTTDPVRNWGNLSSVTYRDLGTAHFGGSLKTTLIPLTSLWVKAVGYFYNVEKGNVSYTDIFGNVLENKAYGKPGFTAEAGVDITPIKNLTVGFNYLLLGSRKGYISGVGTYTMKDVNELNVKAEYRITDWISVYGRLTNILNQKYELIPGYTLQGFNAMGGVNLKF